MFRLTDKRGCKYYIKETDLSEYYQSFEDKIVGAASYIEQARRDNTWILCRPDDPLCNEILVLASEIYIIEEVKR